ncbi:hypothetical protein Mgra_00000681, partial [Meloidogyne graminicola]
GTTIKNIKYFCLLSNKNLRLKVHLVAFSSLLIFMLIELKERLTRC